MSDPLNIDIESIVSECAPVATFERAEALKNADTCWRILLPLFKNERMKIVECRVVDVLTSATGIIIEFINTSEIHDLVPPIRVSYRIDTFFLSKKEAQDAAVLSKLTGNTNR